MLLSFVDRLTEAEGNKLADIIATFVVQYKACQCLSAQHSKESGLLCAECGEG